MMSFADLISVFKLYIARAGPTWNSVFNSVIGRGVHCPTCVVKDGLGIKRGLLFVNGHKL